MRNLYLFLLILIIIFLVIFLFYFSKSENKDILIIENFFDNYTFGKIFNNLNGLKLKNDKRITSRKTLCLDQNKYKNLYDLIYKNKKFRETIKSLNKNDFLVYPDFPIEYREYPNGSSGMRWHKDVSLFSPDCLEVVLTLENNSDSKFQWEENNKIKEIKPEKNTLVIVKPKTVLHRVTPVKGNRKILKFIVQFKDSKKTQVYYNNINNCPF